MYLKIGIENYETKVEGLKGEVTQFMIIVEVLTDSSQ